MTRHNRTVPSFDPEARVAPRAQGEKATLHTASV
jgi:hypothetical protein